MTDQADRAPGPLGSVDVAGVDGGKPSPDPVRSRTGQRQAGRARARAYSGRPPRPRGSVRAVWPRRHARAASAPATVTSLPRTTRHSASGRAGRGPRSSTPPALCDAGVSPSSEAARIPLSELTTLRLGGPAQRLLSASAEDQVLQTAAGASASGEPLLVLGGGSNLVISDAGFAGTALRIATRGVSVETKDGRCWLSAAAGEPWDDLVARCVAEGLSGVECLSGIPGLTGATPIQNVGAYGQQVSETIVCVRAYDRSAGRVINLSRDECRFAYRSSHFRHTARYVILEVSFELERSRLAAPISYPELARALGVSVGSRPPLEAVREAVLELRRGKGMVSDPDDPDSVSAGSFFLNPVLSLGEFAALERRSAERLGEDERPPGWPAEDGAVKTSAAWLIERAGFHRGYGTGRVGISAKHTLALVNRGGASTAELVALAREIRDGVQQAFGVTLRPEPTLVGVTI
ncbi:MAG TPA: UDP-N-acetylmuramate dehydrogenase [Solirubrobacteraceae bacterium]|nr:UDP-N-acetylmuramate dehydrogenase [Solirubrobacteraceae bacterium]